MMCLLIAPYMSYLKYVMLDICVKRKFWRKFWCWSKRYFSGGI